MAKAPKTNPDPVTTDEAVEPVVDTPTPEEARAMFAENPGLWAVMTTEGNKLRGEC